jgi:tellurite resistance protein TehA-like permease
MRVEPSSKGEIIFQNDEERQQSGYGVEIAPVTSVCSSRRDSKAHVYPSVWLRLPNTSFGISMGLAGQAIMWNSASNASFIRDHIDTAIISTIVWLLALLVGVVLFMAYCTKLYFYFPLCKDEYKDPSRIHFFNMPHLITIMLTISVPTEVPNMMTGVKEGQRIIWLISFIIQVCFTQHVYESWLFSEKHNINCARPQFLLSTVGWMLLAVLGAQVDIEGTWGLPLPTWCLGFGLMLYLMVAISVLNAIHHSPKAKGAPAHFLLIAPPATAVVATDLLDLNLAKFSFMGELLLGFCLGIFVLLVSIGPKIWQLPPVLGAYWAYVFPLSALAGAMIRYAWVVDTLAAQVAAIIFLIIAVLATCIVCARMMYHSYRVFAGYAEWDDPLLSRERLVSVKAMSYSELIHDFEETA